LADELERPGDDEGLKDEAHAPPPTIWPFAFAFGIALVLLGLVITSWLIVAIGSLIALFFAFLWIREATREVRGQPAPPPPGPGTRDVVVEDEGPSRYPRNVFLEGATLGIGAVIGGLVTLPVIGFALAPSFVDQGSEDVNLGPLDNFPENQWKVTKFKSVKDEPEDVSRRSAFIRYNGPAEDGQPSFTIISNRCVHLGCPVQPTGVTGEAETVETDGGKVLLADTAPSGFACPCHGGAYDIEGNRVAGPPVHALDRYEYSIIDGNLVLGQVYTVGVVDGTGADVTIKAYPHHDPGEHVDGPEQYFYPYVPGQ
jgi:menaquinol-cytochrome c reductase iron-sulfur subunit